MVKLTSGYGARASRRRMVHKIRNSRGAGCCLSLSASVLCVPFTFCSLASLLWSSCLKDIPSCAVCCLRMEFPPTEIPPILPGWSLSPCCCLHHPFHAILPNVYFPLDTLVPICVPGASKSAICYSEVPSKPPLTTSTESSQALQFTHFIILPSCPLFILV